MTENTKCECGHQNPVASVLCEACGKPQYEPDESEGEAAPLSMKYDGAARRSQLAQPGLTGAVWKFLSSVKVAVWLIIITLLASILGTLLPQESTFIDLDASVFYKETYGFPGQLYYALGLSHTYETWWFRTLLLLIGASLVVCSLDRVMPLYRALSKQQIRKHPTFIHRQKISYRLPLPPEAGTEGEWVKGMGTLLRKKGYRVHFDEQGTALLAEKHRFSRWGPYINHIGLILFIGAVLMRSIPGWHMDQYIGFPEGRPVPVPGTPYYLLNEQFTVEAYESNPEIPKLFETQAVLYTCTAQCDNPLEKPELEEVHRQAIIVNKPLSYKGLLAFQSDYKEAPMLISVAPHLIDKRSGEDYGSFELSMFEPLPHYRVGPYTLDLRSYLPDFSINDQGQPVSRSKDPNAPGFVFVIKGPDMPSEGGVYMFFPRKADQEQYRQDQLNGDLASKLDLTVGGMENVRVSAYTSYLNIRMDKAMPFIWTGAGISMTGLIMGFYWQHRRIWLRGDDGKLLLGAHTNKNWFGLRKEVAWALKESGIDMETQPKGAGGTGS